jgi:hypothetical protein
MVTVLYVDEYYSIDQLAKKISDDYLTWESKRQVRVAEWKEIQEYIFATDTTKTGNSKLPWSNKTTLPKLCQIRDNLFANYMSSTFPKREWMEWIADNPQASDPEKRKVIKGFMKYSVDRNEFYDEVAKLILDYIDYGNVFGTAVWMDNSQDLDQSPQINSLKAPPRQSGYTGPMIKRISPMDIVFNPIAPSFAESPKIIRSFISIGELKAILNKGTDPEDEIQDAQLLYDYFKRVRESIFNDQTHGTNLQFKDRIFQISGFDNYRNYLETDTIEVLTFYGDYYDKENDEYKRNRIIKVVDRHKIISNKPNPSYFGTAPIFHCGWRIRPDNLWAMGPLDNLVGMQYRVDHLENMKADIFDLIAAPPIKVKGYVGDFEWGPFERIYTDENGDVELLSPDVQALQADTQIMTLMQQMEEMAGSPKEAVGFRTPGEKTKYEVQRLENAASRVFENKIKQFERGLLENCLNAMLELARRNLKPTTIRVFNDDLKIETFMSLTADDLTGAGRIRPVAARHFAEQAQQVQDLNSFFGSFSGQDPAVLQHFSSVQLAKLWEANLNLEQYNIVQPFVRLSEQAEMQQLANIHEENTMMSSQTPGMEDTPLPPQGPRQQLGL